jgi:hypothetical protein
LDALKEVFVCLFVLSPGPWGQRAEPFGGETTTLDGLVANQGDGSDNRIEFDGVQMNWRLRAAR